MHFLFPVAGCRIHDPQVSSWLLDPANPSSCYRDLLTKHLGMPQAPPALGAKKVGGDSSSENLTEGLLLLAGTQLNAHLTDIVTLFSSQGSLASKADLFIPFLFLCLSLQVSQLISGLSLLYRLNRELHSKLRVSERAQKHVGTSMRHI